ncbi:MAG: (2Fe-2S) ferredoxin domain-containing protein [Clostridia bacterium]|nr:(2Fe-2S) ferredoxin domain-containing protein [Clostridia bacterium]
MKLSVCIGTTCHLRGSREIIEQLQELIHANGLKEKVDMSGKFCLGRCEENGVSVSVDGENFALTPDNTQAFFEKEILGRV